MIAWAISGTACLVGFWSELRQVWSSQSKFVWRRLNGFFVARCLRFKERHHIILLLPGGEVGCYEFS